MKINKELSDKIYGRYLELKSEDTYNKGYIQRTLREEFNLPKSTCFDHSAGRHNKSVNYKVFKHNNIPGIPVSTKERENTVTYKSNDNINSKIILADIETFSSIGYVWGKWKQNVIDFQQDWFILSMCWKELGSDEVHSVALPDFPGYEDDKINDYHVVKKIWEVLDNCEIFIGHNGDKFDIRKIMTRFLYHGFPPPSPFKTVDTVKVARKYFGMNSNKLDDIGRFLGLGRKLHHTGWHLWKSCFEGDLDAWKDMVSYNEQDVILLEKVYEKFKPFITNHPNLNMIGDTTHSCPNCGSDDLQKRGFTFTRTTKSQRYQCVDCFAWSSGNKVVR